MQLSQFKDDGENPGDSPVAPIPHLMSQVRKRLLRISLSFSSIGFDDPVFDNSGGETLFNVFGDISAITFRSSFMIQLLISVRERQDLST